jgi:hypothetical protein
VDAAERKEILSRYIGHTRRFDEVAARRQGAQGPAEVIPFSGPLRELEQEPTAREIEVLQLISRLFHRLWKSLNRGMHRPCGRRKLRLLADYQPLPYPAKAARATRRRTELRTGGPPMWGTDGGCQLIPLLGEVQGDIGRFA